MVYENLKVLEISLSVYLGDEYKNNNWKDNQEIFKDKIKDLSFDYPFSFECPIEDLICVQLDYEDSLEPLAKAQTVDNIYNVYGELMKVFGEDVKINIYLDGYLENGDNCVDMGYKEFADWLKMQLKEYENQK